jgi:transcriptional regulator with GAF, ATPase, and Fis domain
VQTSAPDRTSGPHHARGPTSTEATTRHAAPIAPSSRTYLVAFVKNGAESHLLASGATTVVGRGLDCDVRISSPALSRRHFSVLGGPAPVVRDLGSANGTALNGVRLPPNAAVPLERGALIEAGGLFFMLRDDRDPQVPSPVRPSASPASVVIEDPAMARLHDLVAVVANSTMPVLVVGETGVGKEILATAVHRRSQRAARPLVRVNCAALPETLLESELFGYEKGAFTGATQPKRGLIEAADGGTFFLDEIGEMPLPTQAKLLRVLETGEVMRLGSLRPRPVDVRFVAATNAHLPALVAKGAFRRDLYYRINGITIPVPPLRERRAEIPSLARAFLAARAAERSGRLPEISPEAMTRLLEHEWPGNVRQLKNVVDRAVAICAGHTILPEHVVLDSTLSSSPGGAAGAPEPAPAAAPALPTHPTPGGGLMRVDPNEDRAKLVEALERAGGNQGRAAEILGVSRRTLMKWMDDHRLPRPRKGDPSGGGQSDD